MCQTLVEDLNMEIIRHISHINQKSLREPSLVSSASAQSFILKDFGRFRRLFPFVCTLRDRDLLLVTTSETPTVFAVGFQQMRNTIA